MTDIIPKGRVIEVKASVIVPDTATFKEVDEWESPDAVRNEALSQ